MEEFAAWKDREYFRLDQNSYISKYINTSLADAKRHTYKELATEFIKTKGIL